MSTIPSVINDGQITASDDGGNSDILDNATGDFSVSGITPSGQEAVPVDSRGSYVGLRKGARVPVTGSFSVFSGDPGDDFASIASGTIAGYVSTTVAVGDLECCDLEFDFGYSATPEVRKLLLDDCHIVRDMSEGNPSTHTYNFTCYGRVRIQNDAGTQTIRSGL